MFFSLLGPLKYIFRDDRLFVRYGGGAWRFRISLVQLQSDGHIHALFLGTLSCACHQDVIWLADLALKLRANQ